ncbi:MAG: sigma 54-interacting transcriptional regulator [Lentisphaeria bacterium]|nr:sigma 54-interacting transcriptional regulator [Lentisphaeria bacterium]
MTTPENTDDLCGFGQMPPCQQILDVLPTGLIMVDEKGLIRTWNRMMERLTGYVAEEVLGKPCSLLACTTCVHRGEEGQSPRCRLLDQARTQEGEFSADDVECMVRTKNGELIPVLKNIHVLTDDNGTPSGMLETVTDLRRVKNLEKNLAELRESVHPPASVGRLVGASEAIHEVYGRIRLAADSTATVLLLGETGTGKELVAEAIHNGSIRHDRPFVKVNCSALADPLLESELFGHVRGAFTGAVQDKIGRFEAADGGTLLLDEIGDISPMIQLKLLRVLQEQEFERVGESTPTKVDVRVICATHRDLRRLVQEGGFREDLFYRIRVFPVQLPALRERKSDIPLLINSFIGRFNKQTGKRISGLTSEALHCLMDYCWPGNVRELENAIEHAFVTCQQERIDFFDLPPELRMVELRSAYCREERFVGNAPERGQHTSSANTREEFLSVLRQCGWNQSEVARRLGIDRTTVWRKIKRWNLSPETSGETGG